MRHDRELIQRLIGVLLVGIGPGAGWAEAESASSSSGATATPAPQLSTPPTQEYDFGDLTSQTLAMKGWDALSRGDHQAVEAYTKKCIQLYESKAIQQNASLTEFAPKDKAFSYWALNDVATSYFILGQSLLPQGKVKEAQTAFQTVVDQFQYAQAWDPKGWFWKVAEASIDKLMTIGTPYDFGDYKSETLTTKAWGALANDDHRGVELYTKKCFELYEDDAKRQQAELTDFAPKDKVFSYWALNDVATSYFIWGESLLAQQRYQEAKVAFERIIDEFSFAQAWDPKGWFWKLAVGARDRLNKILILNGT
jgi:tetratricopeptide (TPR) repeat protein